MRRVAAVVLAAVLALGVLGCVTPPPEYVGPPTTEDGEVIQPPTY